MNTLLRIVKLTLFSLAVLVVFSYMMYGSCWGSVYFVSKMTDSVLVFSLSEYCPI